MAGKKRKQQESKGESRKQWDVKKLGKIQAAKIGRAPQAPTPGEIAESFDWKRTFALAPVVMLLALLPHVVSLSGGIVFNDKATLALVTQYQNTGFMWQHTLKAIFTRLLEQPWVTSCYYMDGQKFMDHYEWWHLSSLWLHILSALYLYALVLRVSWNMTLQKRLSFDPYWLAFITAGIFACHPLVSQAVAYLSGRWALLMTVNYLAALNLFLVGYLAQGLGARFWGYTAVIVFALMSIGSSTEAVSLPFVMMALALILKKPDVSVKRLVGSHIGLVACLSVAGIALVTCLVRGPSLVYAYCPNWAGLPEPNAIAYWATQCKVLFTYYLRCAIIPLGLSIDPPLVRAESFGDPLSVLGTVLLGAVGFFWWKYRASGVLCLALTLVTGGLSVHMLVPQKEVVADTVMYLPLGGVCLLLALALSRVLALSLKKGLVLLAVIMVVLGGLSMWRNGEYSSELRLLEAAVRANQASAFAHARLSLQQLRGDKPQSADKEAAQAYKLDNRLPVVLVARGQTYLAAGRYYEAKTVLSDAVELSAKVGVSSDLEKLAKLGLAEAYVRLHEPKRAEELALPYSQGDVRASELCGLAELDSKNYERALIFLSMVVRQEPSRKECWEPIAIAAFNLNMYQEALQASKMAMEFSSSNEIRLLLAKAALATKSYADARKMLTHLIDAGKADAEIYALMSHLELVSGDKALASSYAKDAAKLDPHAQDKVKWLQDADGHMEQKSK